MCGEGARNLLRIDAVARAATDTYGDREVEDRTSWKPEVPFMAGSVESPVRETSHTAHTPGYVHVTGSSY